MNGVLVINLGAVSDANFEAFFHVAKDAFCFAEIMLPLQFYTFFFGIVMLYFSIQVELSE